MHSSINKFSFLLKNLELLKDLLFWPLLGHLFQFLQFFRQMPEFKTLTL
jgi:hypothetical protein